MENENHSASAKAFVDARYKDWKKRNIFLRDSVDKHNMQCNVEKLMSAGWNDARIESWMNLLVDKFYHPRMFILVHYSSDTSADYKMLHRMNNYSEHGDCINRALDAYPNDIDKAYAEMLRLHDEYFKQRLSNIKSED